MRGIWWRHKSDEDSSTTASPIDLNRNASLMTISHLQHCFKYASLMKICPMSSRLGRHTTDLLFLWKVPAILRGSRNRILTLVQKKNVWFRCTFFCYFLSYFWCFGINIKYFFIYTLCSTLLCHVQFLGLNKQYKCQTTVILNINK